MRPLADATLDAVGGLMQRGGRPVALVLKEVRRFRRRGDQGVVVLVEAMVDGRKTLLSGAAFSADSFERASVVAVLQATNTFVAGALEFPRADEQEPEAKPVPSGHAPSDSSKTPAPKDYVSEVLSRIQSTRRSDRAPPPSS